MLRSLVPGGTFLLNTPLSKEEIWPQLPTPVQQALLAKKARFFVIDATSVARASGMGGRINTIMQVCFFALSGVLPKDEAIEAIKESIKKTYGRKGEEIVQMNLKAVDNTLGQPARSAPDRAKSTAPATFCPPFHRTPRRSCATCWANSPPGWATTCRSARFPRDGTFPTGDRAV